MSVGVKRVVLVNPNDGNVINKTGNEYLSEIVIKADQIVIIKADYHAGTSENKRGRAKWIIKSFVRGEIYTEDDKSGKVGDEMEVKIPAKLCGSYYLNVEAFLNKPENKAPTRIFIIGKAPQKITSTTWSKTEKISDIGSTRIKYGDDIWVHIQSEGLNNMSIEVDVFNTDTKDKGTIYTKAGRLINGELKINFKNTFSWRERTGWNTKNSGEKFYVEVRLKGSSKVLNNKAPTYLYIKDEITKRTVADATTSMPLKQGNPEKDVTRSELCRFQSISITEKGKQPILLFDEGKLKIEGDERKEFQMSETINFNFDESNIRTSDKVKLKSIITFLNDSPYIPVEIGAHCDIKGTHKYNDNLSWDRAKSLKKYLVDKGVALNRITHMGYGKRKLLIKGENLSPKQDEQNRRATIKLKIFENNAESIIYSTIAPDKTKKKEISVDVENYKTVKCFKKNTEHEHDEKIYVVELTQDGKKGPYKYNGNTKVYSNLSKDRFVPLDYIFPHKTTPNKFQYFVNSCRYYFDKKKPSVEVYVYPDIKWDFHFFLNLSNTQSVKWQALGPAKLAEMQKKAGKIGAEQRWKQAEIDFGVILEAKWNKISDKKYEINEELTLKFESKIKKFYEIFAQLKDASKIITGKTKGKAIKVVGKKFPLGVEVLPPNFCFGAEWQLARGIKNNREIKELGTFLKFYFKAEPLLGVELTLDLLQFAITATGPAAPILSAIRYWLQDDETSAITVDLYVNLIIFGTIQTELELMYNTASDKTDPNQKIVGKANATVGLKIEAGLVVKARMVVIVAEFYAEAYAKFEGKGSITFGHELIAQYSGISYRPNLLFDGVIAKVEIKATIGLEIKKGWFSGNYDKDLTNFEEEYKLIKPFDIIEVFEELTGISATIPIIG